MDKLTATIADALDSSHGEPTTVRGRLIPEAAAKLGVSCTLDHRGRRGNPPTYRIRCLGWVVGFSGR